MSSLSLGTSAAAAPAPPATADRKGKSKAAHHLSAGALSGFTSAICLQPLDLLKTRLQQGYASESDVPKRWVLIRSA